MHADLALDRDLDRRRKFADERSEKTTEPLGKREERAQRIVGLGDGEVDGERHELAGEGELHHVGDRVPRLVLGLPRARPEVRRDDHRVDAEQRRLRCRFGGEDVERCAGHVPVAERFGERDLVDDPTAGDVDHAQPRLGLEQQVATDQAGCLGSLRQMNREEIGLRDDLFERHQLDTAEAGAIGRHVRVEGDEAHPERSGPVGDQLADASEADDAERLLGEFDTLPFAALPAAFDERGVSLRDVAGLGEQ